MSQPSEDIQRRYNGNTPNGLESRNGNNRRLEYYADESQRQARFAELFALYEKEFLSFIRRFFHCTQEHAEDLLQQVVVKVWTIYNSQPQTIEDLKQYFFTAIKHTEYTAMNRKSSRIAHESLDLPDGNDGKPHERPIPDTATLDPLSRLIEEQNVDRVREIIESLNQLQRDTLLAHFQAEAQGITDEQKAKQMGLNEITFRTRLLRARQAFREAWNRRNKKSTLE
jgi:RNA polymerase sigma factor (sigma-70 family)